MITLQVAYIRYIVDNFRIIAICCFFFFFFQAEDGIRDFCLSRGLGDVYKRQVMKKLGYAKKYKGKCEIAEKIQPNCMLFKTNYRSVSYTHLTLPTKRIV